MVAAAGATDLAKLAPLEGFEPPSPWVETR